MKDTMEMRASDALVEKLKEFEGLRLRAYRCPAGVWTIGHGHTRGVRQGQVITAAQAETLLRGDLLPVERHVGGLGVCRTQGQFDALCDFAFNLGTAALDGSTLLAKIRAGASVAEIQRQFRKWVYGGGKVLPGLVRRREWDARRWAE